MISDFPLFIFTVLAGLASGGYVGAAILSEKDSQKEKPWLFPLVSLILLAVGGISAFMHLGRPELAYHMVGNLSSPLMLEGIMAGCLAVISAIDVVTSRKKLSGVRAVRIIGAVFGVGCMIAMTYAYAISFGNDAWAAGPTYLLFITGSLAGGVALWAVLTRSASTLSFKVIAVLDAIFACVLVWQAFTFTAVGADGTFCIASGALVAAVGVILAFVQPKMKVSLQTLMLIVAVFSIAALVVSRYGFYMASII